ncbi:2OG-Fe(II) oxygenase [Pseudomonadaceae bacterium Sa2CUA2]|uniref:2OG-Fe(II) oxygenase n=1 Tax=Serpens gallinarum TaxID=2763075 RepID=A0ABR8TIX7_9PSED|nr:2OG-Fe(II) oxygenase [Serpens gallinarum]MBD7975714.1 2OG-Fe(II) oxygenase [Serpens gallinarum]
MANTPRPSLHKSLCVGICATLECPLLHPSGDSSLLAPIIDDLVTHGWSQQPVFLPQTLTAELAQECRTRNAAGELAPAAIGRGGGQIVNEGIRNDHILWLEAGQSAAGDQYLALLDELRQALNRELFLGLEELECHFALYPPGGYYLRHLDRFRDDDCRTVTVVAYLNEADWLPEHGGALRLHLPDGPRDVVPMGGTLICFMSDRIEHEVLPATRPRLSLAGWFRRRPL